MGGQSPTPWDPLEKIIYSISIQSHALVISILPHPHLPVAYHFSSFQLQNL